MYLKKKNTSAFKKFKYKEEIQKLCIRDLKGIFNINNKRGLLQILKWWFLKLEAGYAVT